MNDDIANYHAASSGNGNLPSDDRDVNTWGNLWAAKKFQGCRCDGGWGGNDCSLRQCPRGDDPETQCAEDLGNDVQYIECTKLVSDKESFINIRFVDQLGNRYSTRAIVLPTHSTTPVTAANHAVVGADYVQKASHSIQTALESLPNFVIPKVEVTTTTSLPEYPKVEKTRTVKVSKKKTITEKYFEVDYTQFGLKFELKFTDARNSGEQYLLEIVSDKKCDSGVQP